VPVCAKRLQWHWQTELVTRLCYSSS